MGKLILFIYFFVSTLGLTELQGQTPVYPYETNWWDVESGAYIKDQNDDLDHYVGEWKYMDGNASFTLEITKVEAVLYEYIEKTYYRDELFGNIKQVDENGLTLVNTLDNSELEKYPVMAVLKLESNYVILGYVDQRYEQVWGHLWLEKTTDLDIIEWKLEYVPGTSVGTDDPRDVSVPTEMTLTRVE